MYQFNDQGNLRDFAAKQDAFLTNLMTKRGLLPLKTPYKALPLNITGPAKSLIKVKLRDTTAVNSLQSSDEFDFKTTYCKQKMPSYIITKDYKLL
jgi:hypothetical protein